jgi:hypothetical protein
MWHHQSVIALFRIVLQLLTDLMALTALAFRQRRATAAEILVLRRQIALYKERGIKPRRIDPVTRISLALLCRFFNWRDALVVVRPETMIRWHRAGWRLFWRLKSRPGRPPIPLEIQALIRRTPWGQIHHFRNYALVEEYQTECGAGGSASGLCTFHRGPKSEVVAIHTSSGHAADSQ